MASHEPKYDGTEDKKVEIAHHEIRPSVSASGEKAPDLEAETASSATTDIDAGFDPATVKRTMRRVDRRLLPILSAMYCVSLIDRTNLSLARQANDNKMNAELDLAGTNNHYTIVTLAFFVPYIILEIPSQLGLRAFGARLWLGTAVTAWGAVMVGMGFSPNWQTLAGLRALLGVFEAALFPGATFLISCWYPRRDMARRNTWFYIASSVVGNFASPLGYCFTLMDGLGGISGWGWVFIMFGIITIVIGGLAYIFLVDFPHKSHFLTEEEKDIVLTRIDRDRGDAVPDKLTWRKVVHYCADFKVWLFAFFFMATTLASYSQAYFLPVILATMGFKNVETMLLGTPASAWSIIPGLLGAYVSDRYRHMRAAVIMVNACMLIMGTAMYSQLPLHQKAARYAGVFFAVGGANSNVPLVMAWAQTSIRSQSKRGFYAAVIVAFGGLGGIFASITFMQKEYLKGYPTGIFFTIGCNAAVVLGAAALSAYFRRQNRRADRGEVVLEDSDLFRYQG